MQRSGPLNNKNNDPPCLVIPKKPAQENYCNNFLKRTESRQDCQNQNVKWQNGLVSFYLCWPKDQGMASFTNAGINVNLPCTGLVPLNHTIDVIRTEFKKC